MPILQKFIILFIVICLILPAMSTVSGSEQERGASPAEFENNANSRAASSVRETIEWSGVMVIEDDVVVGSGQVLEIAPWSRVYMKAGTGIYIDGSLRVNGEADGIVTINGLTQTEIWKGIKFNENANTLSSYINHCLISEAEIAVAYHTGTITADGLSLKKNGVGLKAYLSNGEVINGTFDNNDVAVQQDFGITFLSNCSITNSVNRDLVLGNESTVIMNNVSFDEAKIRIDDIYSKLEVNRFIKITINDAEYPNAFETELDIFDLHGTKVYTETIDPTMNSGWIKCLSLGYTQIPAEPGKISKKYYTSHLLSLERFSAVQNHLVYLEANKHVTVDWHDLSTKPDAAGKSVSESDQMAFLQDLVNIGWRHTLRQEKIDAFNYIRSRMRTLGPFVVELDNYTHINLPIDNGTNFDVNVANVVATLPGSSGDLNSYIAVSAHYDTDHHANVVGADDDGSGVSALLEIARIIGHMKFNTTIKFIFFDAEEEGYVGSYDYVKKANSSGHDIIADINLDMIGYNQDSSFPCIIRTNPESLSLAQMVSDLEGQYDFGLDVKVVNDASYRRSDYFRFWDFGFRAINFIEAEVVESWNPYYHTAQDTYDKINFTYLSRMTGLALSGLMKLAEPQNIAPTDPVILSPSLTHLLRPILTWQPSVDQNGDDISYRLEVFDTTSRAFSRSVQVVDTVLAGNHYIFGTNLTFGSTYNVKLTASDGRGASSSTVELVMEVVNTPPVLEHIPDQNLTQDISWTLQLMASDDDIPADILEFSSNTTLFVIDKFTGLISWTPTKYDVGTHLIEFSVTDGNSLSANQTVEVIVANVNDPPDIMAFIKTIVMNEDTVVTDVVNLNTIFRDQDGDDLTFSVVNASNIVYTINGNGSVDIVPFENWYGEEQVELTAMDPQGANSSVEFDIVVTPVNDAPVLEPIADIVLNETEVMEVNSFATDVDDEVLSFNFSGPGNSGKWSTDFFSSGEYLMNISVSDGKEKDWQEVKITVLNKNRLPGPENELPVSMKVKEDERFKLSVNFLDPDDDINGNGLIDLEELDNLSYQWDLGDGTILSDRSISHSYKEPGDYTIRLTVFDNDNGTVELEMKIEVEERGGMFGEPLFLVLLALVLAVIFITILLYLKRVRSDRSITEDTDGKTDEEEVGNNGEIPENVIEKENRLSEESEQVKNNDEQETT